MVGLPQIDDCARYRRAGRGIGNPPRQMKHRRSCRGISREQIAILSQRRGAIEGTLEIGPRNARHTRRRIDARTAERSVGKECVSTWSSGWSPESLKKKTKE